MIIFLQTSVGWYKVVMLQMLKLSIKSFFFLFTSPLCTFSGVLTNPCSFPITGIGLDSSCCCQVTLPKFCNINCAGLLITSLWRTGVWVILLPYFKLFLCHWVWCACHLEECCHNLIFLLLTFSLRILKLFFILPTPLFFPAVLHCGITSRSVLLLDCSVDLFQYSETTDWHEGICKYSGMGEYFAAT